jgi:hypothetical protein
MNYTQSFEEFSSGLAPTDLALYAGLGIVLFVLFKDEMSPVQKFLLDLFNKAKDTVTDLAKPDPNPPVTGPVPVTPPSPAPILIRPDNDPNKVFFQMVASWKQTRDLAAKQGCESAVKSLDDVFQYLAPTVCEGEK